jgi:hypothetical protein
LGLSILLAVATVGASAFVINSSRQKDIPSVANKTQALLVTGVQIEGPSSNGFPASLSIQLKNVSEKTITGYALSLGPSDFIMRDFHYTEYKNPGDSFALREPLDDIFVDGKSVSVAIESVIFQDRTFDGNDKVSATMINRRLGEREQQIQSLRLIENTLRKPDSELPPAIQVLEQDISSLATSDDPAQVNENEDDFWRKKDMERGRAIVRENMKLKIQALKKGSAYSASSRSDLSSIAEECRNNINKW